jgi:hypothetical protein
MRSRFDRRVLPDDVLELVRALQRRVPCHLAGGAALSGAHLAHRLSGDVDLFCHDARDLRELVASLGEVAAECAAQIVLVRDAGHLARADVRTREGRLLALDLIHESVPDLEPTPPPLESIVVESLTDLRATKLTCLLSRSEPRDLVDILFLERAGYTPERDLEVALRKDAGLDPGILAWLLRRFPTHPLPVMLEPLTEGDLIRYRDELGERFRRLAVPDR